MSFNTREGLKVYISGHESGYFGYGITFVDRRNGKTFIARPVELVFEEVEEGAMIKPTLQLPDFFGEELYQALHNELDRVGFKAQNESKLEGELTATKYHLEDMRRIALKIKK